MEKIPENHFQFQNKLFIGLQAEACFKEYILNSKNYQLLAANLQIHTSTKFVQSSSEGLSNQNEKKTLGELDYLVRNIKTNQVVHIELACKFYLYEEKANVSEEEKWIGPNRKDSLIDKLKKVKLNQFPLLHKKETIEKLHELSIDIPTSQQLCLKAFLFIPKKMEKSTFQKNYKDCVVGFWIRFSELNEEDETALFAIPIKKEWLLPEEYITSWHSFSEVKKEIEQQLQNKKSPLIYKKTLHKIERFFVVWW